MLCPVKRRHLSFTVLQSDACNFTTPCVYQRGSSPKMSLPFFSLANLLLVPAYVLKQRLSDSSSWSSIVLVGLRAT